ncbi:MAG: hypothetical protein IKJ58_07735 [Akkermansia sp.]|nr:hypothetical protein [Akkermansia sp.]
MPKKLKSRGTPIEQQLRALHHPPGDKKNFSEKESHGIFSLAAPPPEPKANAKGERERAGKDFNEDTSNEPNRKGKQALE